MFGKLSIAQDLFFFKFYSVCHVNTTLSGDFDNLMVVLSWFKEQKFRVFSNIVGRVLPNTKYNL